MSVWVKFSGPPGWYMITLSDQGLMVKLFNQGKYPAVLATFPGITSAPVMLSGHFDVVPPEPDDIQFEPHIEGDYLWGRGAADMKTVVATYMVWMKDALRKGRTFSTHQPFAGWQRREWRRRTHGHPPCAQLVEGRLRTR